MGARVRLLCTAIAVRVLVQPLAAWQEDYRTIQGVDFPPCKKYAYTLPDPSKDKVADLMKDRYRLVIGASEFVGQDKLSFVEDTATKVDEALAGLNYKPLPSRTDGKPYLVGKAVTKEAVITALKEMMRVTLNGGSGFVYWIGHGNTANTPNPDLALAVYDRPVSPTDGILFSQIYQVLTTGTFRRNLGDIPKLIFVLDTCESGILASPPILQTVGGVQRLYSDNGIVVPPQVGILTATSEKHESFELKGTSWSAFGYFLARALTETEDWPCADTNSPDGIMTLHELRFYLKQQLTIAFAQHMIGGPMEPQMHGADGLFVAYSPSHHWVDGARAELLDMEVEPGSSMDAVISFDGASSYTCEHGTRCSIPVSRGYAGEIRVASYPTTTPVMAGGSPHPACKEHGGMTCSESYGLIVKPLDHLEIATTTLKGLLAGRLQSLAGVTITVK